MAKKVVIISLGGSLIIPNKINDLCQELWTCFIREQLSLVEGKQFKR